MTANMRNVARGTTRTRRAAVAALSAALPAGLLFAAQPAAAAPAAAHPVAAQIDIRPIPGPPISAPPAKALKRKPVPIASATLYVDRMPQVRKELKPFPPRKDLLVVSIGEGCWRGSAKVKVRMVDSDTVSVTVRAASRSSCLTEKTRTVRVKVSSAALTFIDGATGEQFEPELVEVF